MEALNLIDNFSEFKELKNIDRPALEHIIKDVFKAMIAKKYGTDEFFEVIVKAKKAISKSITTALSLKTEPLKTNSARLRIPTPSKSNRTSKLVTM